MNGRRNARRGIRCAPVRGGRHGVRPMTTRLLILASIATVALPQPVHARGSAEKEIRETLAIFYEGWNAHDPDPCQRKICQISKGKDAFSSKKARAARILHLRYFRAETFCPKARVSLNPPPDPAEKLEPDARVASQKALLGYLLDRREPCGARTRPTAKPVRQARRTDRASALRAMRWLHP